MQHKKSKWGRWVVSILALGAMMVVFVNMFIDNMPKGEAQKVEGYVPWEQATIDAVSSIPVQEGGRIKPFSTFAGFQMLGLHGARSMKVEGEVAEGTEASGFKQFIGKLRGKKPDIYTLKPTEWMMDSLFRPDLAVKLPTFRVDNSKVLEALSVQVKGRRDRYSYDEILPGREKLIELARSYEPIEKDDRDPVQQQTIDLAYNFRMYESILSYFSFARSGVTLLGSGVNGEPDVTANVSAVMTTAPQIMERIAASQKEKGMIEPQMQDLLQQILQGANFSKYGLFLLPPKDVKNEIWLTAGNAIMETMTLESKDPGTAIEDIAAMEVMVRSLGTSEKEFRKHVKEFEDRTVARAAERGEGGRIDMEVAYFEKDYFLNGLVYYLLGTLCALAMWGFGRNRAGKISYWATFAFTSWATVLCVIAIVKRCLIMERPPVGNLYDTIIFICATGVIFALIIEWIARKRFALGLAPIIGVMLLILARRYEVGDATDHLNPLVAVLDSNFWLATHVITITLGYSSGLLAAMLSCGYLLMRGLNLDGKNKDLRKSLSKAVYGAICLTVFLSLVGTVLGGIWANYSWGRFWGWDPKENGALMIVLWTLAILHARIGGIIKEWGLHMASVFTACIVAFSWWHVNFLGVGLHNYGFTAGKDTIWVFYGVMVAFMIFGAIAIMVEKLQKQAPAPRNADEVKGLEV